MRSLRRFFATSLAIAALSSCGDGSSGPPALSMTADSPPGSTTGTAYPGYTFAATGGTPSLSWSESGPLPPGLALSTSGQLSGTPTVAGTYPVSVTVTDSSVPPLTTSVSVTLKVSDSTITLVPASPPAGTVSFAYPEFTFGANGGSPPYTWAATGILPPGLTLGTNGSLSGTPTQAGTFSFSVTPTDSAQTPVKGPALSVQVMINPAPPPDSFTSLAAHLTVPRSGHTATMLTSGKVLIAGGGNGVADSSAELYDPAAGTFTATAGSMTEARINHTATLLSDSSLPNYGKVLIVGAGDLTAELYDPTTETFKATGRMNHQRSSPTATLLAASGQNAGKVLIVGGNTTADDLVAELYDPATGTFSDTGSTTILRTGHTATLLTTGPLAGQVLIAGGNSSTAELYSPVTHTFVQTGGATSPSGEVSATLLGQQDGSTLNGEVLFVSSFGGSALYDQSTQSFTTVGSWLPLSRFHASVGHTASLRNDGTVLVAGGSSEGCSARPNSLNAAALFAPENQGFTATGNLRISRDGHTSTTLADGSVLIVGGTHHVSELATYMGWHCVNSAEVLSAVELFK